MILTKNKCFLYKIPKELLKYIVNFLNNNTIIEVLITSLTIHNNLICTTNASTIYTNLFTSISILPTDDLCMSIRRYINHRNSITKTILYRLSDEELKNIQQFWPFKTKEMVHIDRYHRKRKLLTY
jgi:hypothetical protein